MKELLYTTFRGNQATRYGMEMEEPTCNQYTTHQQNKGSPVSVTNCGLLVSLENPWLAATPDGIVQSVGEESNSSGLLEIKKPHSKRNMTLSEVCSSGSAFCLKQEEEETFKLKRTHILPPDSVPIILRGS